MPILLDVLDDLRLILLRVSDPVENSALVEAVTGLSDRVAAAPGFDQLVDCRGMRDVGAMTGQGVLLAGRRDTLLRSRRVGRLAIVVESTAGFGLSRMYLAAADADEADVHVTYSLHEALDWLGLDADRKRAVLARVERPPPAG